MLAFFFYGALVTAAVWATWKDEELCWIGWMLAAGFCLTNILYLTAPVRVQPGPFTVIEMMVALTAYCAWGVLGYRLLVALVAVNLLSIGLNLSLAAIENPSAYQVYVFVVGTNICFAVECILTLGVGIAHGYSTGRFTRRFYLGRLHSQSNAAREEDS